MEAPTICKRVTKANRPKQKNLHLTYLQAFTFTNLPVSSSYPVGQSVHPVSYTEDHSFLQSCILTALGTSFYLKLSPQSNSGAMHFLFTSCSLSAVYLSKASFHVTL